MRALKWIFGTIATVLILAIAGAWIFAQFYLEPILKKQIEERGSVALGSPLTIESVNLGFLPPFRVTVTGIKATLTKPQASVAIERATVVAHIGPSIRNPAAPLGRFVVTIDKPVIAAILPKATEADQTPAPPPTPAQAPNASGNPFEGQRDLQAQIEIRDGSFDVKYEGLDRSIRLSQFNAKLDVPSLMQAWTADVAMKKAVSWDGIKAEIPITTQTTFQYDGAKLTVPSANGDIGGLLFAASGTQFLSPSPAGQWNLKVNVADLAKLPVPPSFLPQGKFAGQIQADINARTGQDGAWTAGGFVAVRQFRGESSFAFNEAKAEGVVLADIGVQFSYAGALQFQKLQANVNLDQAAVAYSNLLSKPKGIPLNLQIDAGGDTQKLDIREAKLVFAQLNAQARGTVAAGAGSPSKVSVDIAKTSLSGWEKFFPVLAGAPITGFVEVKADFEGDLRKPESLSIALAPLLLQDVKGRVQWTSVDKTQSVAGPMEIDARVTVKARGKELVDANISANAVLTQLAILMKDKFEKRAGQPMRLDLKAAKRGNDIELRPSVLDLGQNRFQVSGRVQEPQRPKLNLKFSSPKLVFKELGTFLPAMRETVPDGTGTFTADLNGVFDFKLGIQGSPLRTKANFSAVIPRYVFKSAPQPRGTPPTNSSAQTQNTAPNPVAAAPMPILPDWPILRSSEFKSDVKIDSFLFNDLPVGGIRATNTINLGVLKGAVSVAKVFGGSVNLTSLSTDLKLAQPDLNLNTQFKTIDANAAMTWISKEWKDLVKGSASGQVVSTIAHPSRADFVARTQASGDVTLANAFVSTLQFDKMANDVIAKLPGVGDDRKVSSKGVAADIRLAFEWTKNRALINNFVFLTPENNQISATGTVDLQKNLDLSGTAYLATAPVRGSVREANSDVNGRFTIPIQIKGNMLQPQASFAQASIEGILKNTATFELKKAQGKAQAKLKEEQNKLEDKAKGEINKLGEKIKKEGLKGLFK